MAEISDKEALEKEVTELQARFKDSTPEELLRYFLSRFGKQIALSSSLGKEDQVLLDMIMKIDREARVFTIDTGRLCPETYNLIATDEDYYKIKLEVFFPDRAKVEEYVRTYGINGFYAGHEARKACCEARKLEPLRRALSGLDVWICGLRRSQSVTRSEDKAVEWDARHWLIKLNPLIDWEESDVDAYVKEHSVPVNVLHRKGYPSIGCRPCTRAVQPGEDIRSGRWWWESPLHRECGLHRD